LGAVGGLAFASVMGWVNRLYAAPFLLFFRPFLASCEGGANNISPLQKKKKNFCL